MNTTLLALVLACFAACAPAATVTEASTATVDGTDDREAFHLRAEGASASCVVDADRVYLAVHDADTHTDLTIDGQIAGDQTTVDLGVLSASWGPDNWWNAHVSPDGGTCAVHVFRTDGRVTGTAECGVFATSSYWFQARFAFTGCAVNP